MNRSFILASSFLVAAALAPVAAQADSPREFLRHALAGNNSEIMLGNLAADRGRDPAVREFGRTLARDHGKARGEVLDVGRRFGIRPDRDSHAGSPHDAPPPERAARAGIRSGIHRSHGG